MDILSLVAGLPSLDFFEKSFAFGGRDSGGGRCNIPTPYLSGDGRRVLPIFSDRGQDFGEEPMLKSLSILLPASHDQLIYARLVDNDHVLSSAKGVHRLPPLLPIAQAAGGVARVSDVENGTYIIQDPPWLTVQKDHANVICLEMQGHKPIHRGRYPFSRNQSPRIFSAIEAIVRWSSVAAFSRASFIVGNRRSPTGAVRFS